MVVKMFTFGPAPRLIRGMMTSGLFCLGGSSVAERRFGQVSGVGIMSYIGKGIDIFSTI